VADQRQDVRIAVRGKDAGHGSFIGSAPEEL
jgi:hypothetical protein